MSVTGPLLSNDLPMYTITADTLPTIVDSTINTANFCMLVTTAVTMCVLVSPQIWREEEDHKSVSKHRHSKGSNKNKKHRLQNFKQTVVNVG